MYPASIHEELKMCNTISIIYALLPIFWASIQFREWSRIFAASHACSSISRHKNACNDQCRVQLLLADLLGQGDGSLID